MPKVVKVDPEWSPSKKPDLKVGESIEIGYANRLIVEGKVEIYKEPKKAPKKAAKKK